MPVGLDARWVVRLDVMNRLKLLRKLDAKLAFSAQRIERSTDLVLSARAVLQKIDIAYSGGCGATLFGILWLLRIGDISPKGGNVVILRRPSQKAITRDTR